MHCWLGDQVLLPLLVLPLVLLVGRLGLGARAPQAMLFVLMRLANSLPWYHPPLPCIIADHTSFNTLVSEGEAVS